MICLLDVDGILANFNEGAFRALGIHYYYEHPALHEWEWYEYFNILIEELDLVCTTDFWAGLQWMPDGREILNMIEKEFATDEIYLLTTPMPNLESASGKMMWIRHHLPQYEVRTIITRAPKRIFAVPGRVLVDDKTENCQEFIDCGGMAILVPRPWNARRGHATIPTVRKDLEGIRNVK